ncbi:MAG: VWA domain-containing protein [Acidobacteriota bacterium]
MAGNSGVSRLIVISDGGDNASELTLAQIMAAAGQSDAISYTIGIFDRDDPDRSPGALKKLAEATGGEAFLPDSVNKIYPICTQIARDIRNQYSLAYRPTNGKQDGPYRVITVNARTRDCERLLVRTRAGYYAPLQAQPSQLPRETP